MYMCIYVLYSVNVNKINNNKMLQLSYLAIGYHRAEILYLYSIIVLCIYKKMILHDSNNKITINDTCT